MVFLHVRRAVARHDNARVARFLQLSAAAARQSQRFQAELLRRFHGVEHVFRVSAGGNAQKHVAGTAITRRLLRVDVFRVNVVIERGRKRRVSRERNRRKRALKMRARAALAPRPL